MLKLPWSVSIASKCLRNDTTRTSPELKTLQRSELEGSQDCRGPAKVVVAENLQKFGGQRASPSTKVLLT